MTETPIGNRDKGSESPTFPTVTPDQLRNLDIRYLDPQTAYRALNGDAPQATMYLGDRVMINATDAGSATRIVDEVQRIAAGLDMGQRGPHPMRPF